MMKLSKMIFIGLLFSMFLPVFGFSSVVQAQEDEFSRMEWDVPSIQNRTRNDGSVEQIIRMNGRVGNFFITYIYSPKDSTDIIVDKETGIPCGLSEQVNHPENMYVTQVEHINDMQCTNDVGKVRTSEIKNYPLSVTKSLKETLEPPASPLILPVVSSGKATFDRKETAYKIPVTVGNYQLNWVLTTFRDEGFSQLSDPQDSSLIVVADDLKGSSALYRSKDNKLDFLGFVDVDKLLETRDNALKKSKK